MWSGERSPGEVELHIEDAALAAGFAAAIDFEVDGPDATEAVNAFGRQPWGPFLYDVPEHGVADTRRDFDAMCVVRGLRASLRPVERISHRERVRRAVSAGGSCFMIMGVPVVAASVEATRELPVVGVKVDFGGRVGEQWSVIATTSDDTSPNSTRELGVVGVDYARVLFADADALSSWQHDLPLDGRADVAYWGADVDRAREALGGDVIDGEPRVFGWVNIDVSAAIERAHDVEAWRSSTGLRLAMDFRPHSHHWAALSAARASEHEVGFVDLDGARAALVLTGWGDGLFPVLGDFDERGVLVRVRLVLGDDERAARMEQLNDRWAEGRRR